VTATAALEHFWSDDALTNAVGQRSRQLEARLDVWGARYAARVKGRGMIMGLDLPVGVAPKVSRAAFERGVVMETAGARDEVLKFLPPLTIDESLLTRALDVVDSSLERVMRGATRASERPSEAHP
jgi:diaminobutyrate-2-oxoglutarate transaminase